MLVIVGLHAVSTAADAPFSFALVGDVPYSVSDVARMGELVTDIDNAEGVVFVAHTGDLKYGREVCSDALIGERFRVFQGFDDAFWYTPGDNEWTDCREGDLAADPLERLDHLRSVFFPNPTRTTGGDPIAVTHQAAPHIENVSFKRQCVTFGSIHQVGSDNGSSPDNTDRLQSEVAARIAADAAWVDAIFDRASDDGSTGVFILVHAKPTTEPEYEVVTERITARARLFSRDVVIGHGNDHTQEIEQGFLGLDNVTRWAVRGGDDATAEWVKATVDCAQPSPFSQVVVATGTTPPKTATSPTTGPPVPQTSAPLGPKLDNGAIVGRQAERGRQFTLLP